MREGSSRIRMMFVLHYIACCERYYCDCCTNILIMVMFDDGEEQGLQDPEEDADEDEHEDVEEKGEKTENEQELEAEGRAVEG